jgi:hypothetical protein
MNHFARIALAAGMLATPVLPALAQNGTPLTGTTSPTPGTQMPAATKAAPAMTAPTHHAATTTTTKTHRLA